MDQEQFDQITRTLVSGLSRRGLVRDLAGAAMGGILVALGVSEAGAKHKKKHRKQQQSHVRAQGGPCKSPNSRCGKGKTAECCIGSFSKCCQTSTGASACTDTANDPNNCGACSHRCDGPTHGAGSATCSGGVCGISCSSGLTKCGTECLELSDVNNCGACGNVCTSRTGFTGCCPRNDGSGTYSCVDLGDNNHNCGECGHVCPTCSGGGYCWLAVNGDQRTPICAGGGTCRPVDYPCTSDADCNGMGPGYRCVTSPDNEGTDCPTVCAQTC